MCLSIFHTEVPEPYICYWKFCSHTSAYTLIANRMPPTLRIRKNQKETSYDSNSTPASSSVSAILGMGGLA